MKQYFYLLLVFLELNWIIDVKHFLSTISLLSLVTSMEITKINASFLFQYIYLQNSLFLAIVTSYLTSIARGPLFFAFNSIFSYCRDEVYFFLELLLALIFAIRFGKLISVKQSGSLSFSQLQFHGLKLIWL